MTVIEIDEEIALTTSVHHGPPGTLAVVTVTGKKYYVEPPAPDVELPAPPLEGKHGRGRTIRRD